MKIKVANGSYEVFKERKGKKNKKVIFCCYDAQILNTILLWYFDNYVVDACLFVFADKLNILCPLIRKKYRNMWILQFKTNISLTFATFGLLIWHICYRFSVSFSHFMVTVGANPNYCLQSFYRVICSYTKAITSSLMFHVYVFLHRCDLHFFYLCLVY